MGFPSQHCLCSSEAHYVGYSLLLSENKIRISGRWKHNTSLRVHSYYISHCPWAVQELRSCKSVFPLMSVWSRGKASVTGQHVHCSLTVIACQIRAVPIQRKLHHPLESSNLSQDREGFIYMEILCWINFQYIFLCQVSHCSLIPLA